MTFRSILYQPAPRLFFALGFLTLLGLACFMVQEAGYLWLATLVILLGLTVYDASQLRSAKADVLKWDWNHQPTQHQLFRLTGLFRFHLPPGVFYRFEEVDSDLFKLVDSEDVAKQDNVREVTWQLWPIRRGNRVWPGVYLMYQARFGLLKKYQRFEDVPVSIYPRLLTNFGSKLDPDFLIQQMGIKKNHYRRADQSFESLRPYIKGDNFKHIDWKASARMRGLITRQFQLEHHHQIIVCLDISRLMGTLTEGTSKLDWAIEACLHLSWLASRFQDRMGLMVFSDDIHQWVKPVNHPVQAFLKALYPIETRLVETDMRKACLSVLTMQKKRSLVIFLSDFLEASSLEPAIPVFGQLNRKHCGLFVGIEDPTYHQYLEAPQRDPEKLDAEGIAKTLVVRDAMERRKLVLEQLKKLGLRTLSVTPQSLVQQVMKAYMQIKLEGAI